MAQSIPPRKTFGSNHRQVSDQTPVSVTDDTWLANAREAFQVSTSFMETNLTKDWQASIAHFQSKHMPGSKYHTETYKYRSKLFRPKTRSVVRQVEAAAAATFFSQIDVIDYEAQDDKNPMQLASAALRQELLNHRLTGYRQIPWFQICVGAMQEACVIGVVGSKQFWDYREREVNVMMTDPNTGESVLDELGQQANQTQRIKMKDQPDIKLYPIENLRFDPAAEWTDVVNTSPYFIALDPMRVGEVRAKTKSGEWQNVDDSTLLAARNSAYDLVRGQREQGKEDDKDSRYSKALSDFDIVWVHENFLIQDQMDYHFYTLGTIARLTEARPLEEVYLHGMRPCVVGTNMIEPHRALPDSLVHISKGLNKEANELVNSRMDNVKLVLNKRWLVRRGKQVDLQSLVRNVPASVTLVNDIDKDVFPVEFQDVTSSSYAEQDRLNVDQDELTGSFSTGSVSTNRKLGETVGGLAMLRGTSNTMTQYVIRVFAETWVEKVLNQLDQLEQYYESDMEVLTVVAKRANVEKYGVTQITKDLLMQPARVIVSVANSAMDPTIRLELFLYAMKTYAEMNQIMPPDIDREALKNYIFGLLGFRDGSQFSVDPQGNPQLVAAQQMIEQLQQQLEGKMLEIQAKNEAQFAKIEADKQVKAAELGQQEKESEREARLQLILAQMAEQTKLLIAQLSSDSREQTARNSDEVKALIATLQSNTQQAMAASKSNPDSITYIDQSVKGTIEKLMDSFSTIQQENSSSQDVLSQVVQQLQQNQQDIAQLQQLIEAPRENEIIERDEEGIPLKTRSRIVREPT